MPEGPARSRGRGAARRKDAPRREHSFRAPRSRRCYRHAHRIFRQKSLVTLHRLFSTAALAALACSRAAAEGHDRPGTPAAPDPGGRARRWRVSGDGAWRLHVDAHDVLHRVSLADADAGGDAAAAARRAGAVGLRRRPEGGAGDASPMRRASSTSAAAGRGRQVSWRPWVSDGDGVALGPESAGWVAQMPASCGDAVGSRRRWRSRRTAGWSRPADVGGRRRHQSRRGLAAHARHARAAAAVRRS